MRQETGCGENPQGNREIERRADLAQVGRRQAHRDAFAWEGKTRVADRTAHAIAAFAYGGVGEADHGDPREPCRDVDLDRNGDGVDTKHCGRVESCQHVQR